MTEESSNNEGDSVVLSISSNGNGAANPFSIFATLDAPFIHFDRRVEPIVWQGKDILVQQVHSSLHKIIDS